nr:MAG: hypothetical protein [Bacteriophage sp.]
MTEAVVRDSHGRIVSGACNPTGKGGFQDRPQDRGSWTKDTSPTRWIREFSKLTAEEFNERIKDPNLTMVQKIAIRHILNASKDPKVAADYIDRLDGKARQSTDVSVTGYEPPRIIIEGFDDNPKNTKDHE